MALVPLGTDYPQNPGHIVSLYYHLNLFKQHIDIIGDCYFNMILCCLAKLTSSDTGGPGGWEGLCSCGGYFTKIWVGGVKGGSACNKKWIQLDVRFCKNEGSKISETNEKVGQLGRKSNQGDNLCKMPKNCYIIIYFDEN